MEEGREGVAVFFCHCDGEVSGMVDVPAVMKYAATLPKVVIAEEHEHLCSKEGIARLKEVLGDAKVDRVVMAACSPRTHGDIFLSALESVGINEYLVEFANLREQCAWVHEDRMEATDKAKDLVRMAVFRAMELEPLEKIKLSIIPSALVIGGGVAGMEAALNIVSKGFNAFLVERGEEIGGRVRKLSTTFPTISCGIPCRHDCPDCEFTPKIEEIYAAGNIEVLTSAEVVEVEGRIGDYKVKVRTGVEEEKELNMGTVIIATGSRTFDPGRIPEYGYEFEDVITSEEIELMYLKSRKGGGGAKLLRPSDGRTPKRVDFIQCVGSRSLKPGSNPYCSITCCLYAIGHARAIKEMYPDTEVYIHYTNIQAPYRGFEEYYNETSSLGIKFVRGAVEKVEEQGGQLFIGYEDADLQRTEETTTELVVLSVGQEPSDGTAKLSEMFRIERDIDDFFMEVNPRVVAEDKTGVFIAGCALGPKNIRYAVADGRAAAENAIRLMEQGFVEVEPVIPEVDEDKCIRCGVCESLCRYGGINVGEEEAAEVIAALCRGCGLCVASCPAKALQMKYYSDDQLRILLKTAFSIPVAEAEHERG
ncbi:MAG: CoB--CoM heterodisulfide reductase iron-sulfur subunit A family protein [Methanomicrobia archaeon]|nr:CoB--CoM heterodisulfide reductase iron-sulfur subunit A family protein [Methanomicrobia archaeon]